RVEAGNRVVEVGKKAGGRAAIAVAAFVVTWGCHRSVRPAGDQRYQRRRASLQRREGVRGRGSPGRGRAVVSLAALHLLQDDTVEEHGQLGGADLDAGRAIAAGGGEAKDSFFKSLVPQAPAVLLPGEDLEAI